MRMQNKIRVKINWKTYMRRTLMRRNKSVTRERVLFINFPTASRQITRQTAIGVTRVLSKLGVLHHRAPSNFTERLQNEYLNENLTPAAFTWGTTGPSFLSRQTADFETGAPARDVDIYYTSWTKYVLPCTFFVRCATTFDPSGTPHWWCIPIQESLHVYTQTFAPFAIKT